MSWLKYFLLGDYGQQLDIHNNSNALLNFRINSFHQKRLVKSSLKDMQDELDKMKLLNFALIQVLLANNVFNENDLNDMVEKIDKADSVADGKISKEKKPKN